MKVILNEGFKKLYGFTGDNKKNSEWNKLSSIIIKCPEIINRQHEDLSEKLKEQSESSSWWKDERELETHFSNSEKLYESRCEEIEESKVMMDVTKLLNILYAVQLFTTNVHACFHNAILMTWQKQTTPIS